MAAALLAVDALDPVAPRKPRPGAAVDEVVNNRTSATAMAATVATTDILLIVST